MRALALLLAAAGLLAAQPLKLNLEHLAAKASDSVDISLNGTTLQFAAKFLDGKDPDEAKVKKLIAGIDGIYIRSFEFKKDGEWSPADLEGVRSQLKGPDWSRIVGYKGESDGETEVYLRTDSNKKVNGVAIVVAEPREFTVVNLSGAIDLDSLADLSGHFGVPKLRQLQRPQPQRKLE
jgi:hypothetical protein